MRTTPRRLLATLLLPLAVLAGCGDDDGDEDASPAIEDTADETTTTAAGDDSGALEGSEDDTIVIEGFAFEVKGPVKQNASVTVNNKDSARHTVTMDGGNGFDVPVDGGEGEVFLAVQPPGEYPFHCEIHPNMTGTLVVE